ncbi:MAG: DUF4153 domain-containing protein [Finegoldia magna]|uniref:DUF4153 domain-containing protein n=1 Tax=Finegoldia magna TaxID=1260 RepID=UPI00290E0E58|nr:DUF4153 domain-containing protein [Finegoldia magna]MDU5743061.1 DUF4153 domain-containing protein [Finegoldia magna]MDU5923632.1 DUF4153 domain-containing protein [Finegoldia magna]MDU6599142.1 DUF4153 domain-containing protein [Finegoldia magna]
MKLEILKSKLQTLVKTIKIYPMVLLAIFIATIFSIMEIWKIEFNVLNSTLIVDLIISSLYFAMSYMIVKLIITDKNIEITNGQKAVVYAIVSVIVGLLCYFLIIKVDKSLYLKNQITQMGLFFALFIGMFVAGHFNTEIDYADYAVKIILAIIESLIYCVTIFVGIVAILYTTKELFKLNFNLSNLIVTCAVVIFLLLNATIILSKFPLKYCEENLKIKWLTPFKFLFTRIIAPLFLIYGSILLLYIIKVVVLKTIPNNIITNLILWYGLLSVVVLFVSKTVEDKFIKIYDKVQPLILLILSGMMFYSIGIRISYYGITEGRYMVVIGGVFIVISMIYYLFFNKKTYITIPTTLLILTLISSVGPVSAYNISKIDQKNRLEKMLIEENLLVNGEIKPQKNVNPAKIKEIKDKLDYFTRKHSAKELAYLDEKFTTSEINMKRVFGFRGDEFESLYGKNRFYANNKIEIDTTGYDRLLENIVFEYDFTNQSINNTGNPEVTFSKKSNVIVIQYKGKKIGKLNIEKFRNKLEDFWNEQGPDIDTENPDLSIVDEGVIGETKYKTILERVDSFYDSGQKMTYQIKCLYTK